MKKYLSGHFTILTSVLAIALLGVGLFAADAPGTATQGGIHLSTGTMPGGGNWAGELIVDGNTTLGDSSADTVTITGTTTYGTGIQFEGTTVDANETTLTVVDPTADRTFTLPNATGTAVISTLATNAPDLANSVWGTSNGWTFEGATADAFEVTLTPADPTVADTAITIPNTAGVADTFELLTLAQTVIGAKTFSAQMTVNSNINSAAATAITLSTGTTGILSLDTGSIGQINIGTNAGGDKNILIGSGTGDIATFQSAIGGANAFVFGGAGIDANYTTLAITDPTGARTVTLADASGTVFLSTLSTNAPDAANAIWGESNNLVFEGATGGADTFEGRITIVDPTADRTYTLPDVTGTLVTTGDTGTVTGTMVLDDTIALTTDTSGNYVASANTSVLTGLAGGSAGSEGAALSLAFDYSGTLGGDPALSASTEVFGTTGLLWEGTAADTIEGLLTAPTLTVTDKTWTLPDSTGSIVVTGVVDVPGEADDDITGDASGKTVVTLSTGTADAPFVLTLTGVVVGQVVYIKNVSGFDMTTLNGANVTDLTNGTTRPFVFDASSVPHSAATAIAND